MSLKLGRLVRIQSAAGRQTGFTRPAEFNRLGEPLLERRVHPRGLMEKRDGLRRLLEGSLRVAPLEFSAGRVESGVRFGRSLTHIPGVDQVAEGHFAHHEDRFANRHKAGSFVKADGAHIFFVDGQQQAFCPAFFGHREHQI